MSNFRDEVTSVTEEILLPAIIKVLAPLADQAVTIASVKTEIAVIRAAKDEEARITKEAEDAAIEAAKVDGKEP